MSNRPLEPEEILRAAPLGTIFCAIKDHDGPNDRRAALSRSGVFRFAFGMARESYEAHRREL